MLPLIPLLPQIAWRARLFDSRVSHLNWYAFRVKTKYPETLILNGTGRGSQSAYQNFYETMESLASCHGQWHVSASGQVNDSKYHAGANQVVSRSNIRINFKEPEYIKTNIPVPVIPVGRQNLYLFPERVLVFDRGKVGAVSYEHLELSVTPIRFVEAGTVPRDATVVDKTWTYVNKKGGPDIRFKDNREIPVTLYDEVFFTSSTGLNECIQFSRNGAGEEFRQAIRTLAGILKKNNTPVEVEAQCQPI